MMVVCPHLARQRRRGGNAGAWGRGGAGPGHRRSGLHAWWVFAPGLRGACIAGRRGWSRRTFPRANKQPQGSLVSQRAAEKKRPISSLRGGNKLDRPRRPKDPPLGKGRTFASHACLRRDRRRARALRERACLVGSSTHPAFLFFCLRNVRVAAGAAVLVGCREGRSLSL
jgi:hypothetical protein